MSSTRLPRVNTSMSALLGNRLRGNSVPPPSAAMMASVNIILHLRFSPSFIQLGNYRKRHEMSQTTLRDYRHISSRSQASAVDLASSRNEPSCNALLHFHHMEVICDGWHLRRYLSPSTVSDLDAV